MFRVASRLRFIEPQLACPADQPPEGKSWIHEIKYDGYRCQVLLERGKARVFTRNGYDWTDGSTGRGSVRIRKRDGNIQEERTYPRAADPRGSRG